MGLVNVVGADAVGEDVVGADTVESIATHGSRAYHRLCVCVCLPPVREELSDKCTSSLDKKFWV